MNKTQMNTFEQFGEDWKEAAFPQMRTAWERLQREGLLHGELTPKELALFRLAYGVGWSESAAFLKNRATLILKSEASMATKTFRSSLRASLTMSSIGLFLLRVFGK